MKLQLSQTAAKDKVMGKGWERFEFDKDAPLDDEEIEVADDDANLVKDMDRTFQFFNGSMLIIFRLVGKQNGKPILRLLTTGPSLGCLQLYFPIKEMKMLKDLGSKTPLTKVLPMQTSRVKWYCQRSKSLGEIEFAIFRKNKAVS